MLGALAGDTIGSVLEFTQNADPAFPLFTERSCPTDDGILTGAIAQALLDGQRDFRPYLLEAVRRTEHSTAPMPPCWGSGFYAWATLKPLKPDARDFVAHSLAKAMSSGQRTLPLK